MSALDIYSIVLLIGILLMSSSILLNKKEFYEEHVQNSYSDRKGSDKVYQILLLLLLLLLLLSLPRKLQENLSP